MLTYIIKIEY